jgi:hypothetical protein
MSLDPHFLHLAVRWMHVAAMAVAFGGSVLVLALSIRGAIARETLLQVAASYEWAFWVCAGVLAMTGIGNLGAFGSSLPEPDTRWGGTFELKLVVVLALVVISVPRTLALARLVTTTSPDRGVGTVRRLYGGTTGAFALILALAVTLAHG